MKIKTIGLDREQHHKQRRENARILSYARRKIGAYERKTLDKAPARTQIKRVDLEKNRWPSGKKFSRMATSEKFLSICEFSVEKNDAPNDQILTIEGGELKTGNDSITILLT